MPLRLKSLELHGYKTFAAKINFEFAEGITAIVGPNGSGKSNIADSLRWVLGEQTFSLLRAKKTEDMIFAGSEQRSRSGMASVGITFDNSDGWLPVDFSEVGLSRRAYRDGRNEYYLNGQHVRLKDINELLAQSGLSERTYTILGQGLVDASLALKADERRRLFEEAAGIGLYRVRREESLRRLETTQRNLDRVQDILTELEPRLKSLERQAARAQEYSQVQSDLRVLLHEWYGFHWHHDQKALSEIMELARNHDIKLNEARESYRIARFDFSTFRERLNSLRARLNSWHRHSAQLYENRESVSGELAMLDERQRSLSDNRQSNLIELSRQNEEFAFAKEKVSSTENEVSRLLEECEEARSQAKAAKITLDECRIEKSRLETDIETTRSKIEELAALRGGKQAIMEELSLRKEDLTRKLGEGTHQISKAEFETKQCMLNVKLATDARIKAEKGFLGAERELQVTKKRLAALEDLVKQKQIEGAANQSEQARKKMQLDVLDQAEQTLAGYAEGAKLLLGAGRQSKLNGVRGALSAVLDVPVDLETAISAALGEYIDSILINSGKDTDQALDLLDTDQAERASILPLDWLSPEEPLKIKPDSNCLGVASDLVNVPAELRPVIDMLLGHVLIVKDRTVARRVLSGHPKNTRAVTLRGEVFHATGQLLAGKSVKKAALGRSRQRRELQESLAELLINAATLENETKQTAVRMDELHAQELECIKVLAENQTWFEKTKDDERQAVLKEEASKRELEWQISQRKNIELEIIKTEQDHSETATKLSQSERSIAEFQESLQQSTAQSVALSLGEFQEQVTFWETRLAVGERALSDARLRQSEKIQGSLQMKEQLEKLENRLKEIDKSLERLAVERENLHMQAGGITTQLEELRALIEPAELELAAAESQEKVLQQKETDEQATMSRIERNYTQIQLDLGRKQEALQNLRQKIEDDFGLVAFEYATDVSGPVPLPFEGLVEQLPLVTELAPDLEENLFRQRAQLRRMGAVNIEARSEFMAVNERYLFLTKQVEDLHKAEADLHQVIAELDDLTRREFQKTFDAVAEEFHIIFHRLFNGGSARLTLTDPDNLNETGIDIEARLPGRREQGLSLLSGGERSLTAIALVFALLKVSPTPVCMLDEVDAMLDEANVGRFRDLLLELSKDTQFIIITHNRNTVQAADVIYGVTMGRDSASQIISLKLDEISDEYLK